MRQRLGQWVAALLGVSAYALQTSTSGELSLDDMTVEQVRRAFGGQLAMQPQTKTKWYLDEVDAAERAADAGDLTLAGQLCRAMDRDGVLSGALSTRTSGLVRLPKRFRGRADMVDALQSGGSFARSVFDEMFPATELGLLAKDGVKLGVGIGELVPVEGRSYPVLVRLPPEYLVYRWSENRWYYRSIAGLLPITPGDGRWILHVPGGRMAPWQHALWRALGRAFVRKEHAALYKDTWESKLANPARVATAPAGATDMQVESWFKKVASWAVNTVFAMKPGYDVRLVESNGRGYTSFVQTIDAQNAEMIIAVAGQTVTTDGGTGFANADIHKSIRADLVEADADALAHTINTQGLPQWVVTHFGEDALATSPTVEWDTTPPSDLTKVAAAMTGAAAAITALTTALEEHPDVDPIDVVAILTRFGVPQRASKSAEGGKVVPLVRDDKAASARARRREAA